MFKLLKDKVNQRFQFLSQFQLFEVDLDKNVLFDAYLASFPENERQEHNCNCCKSFLNHYGNVVAIVDEKIETLWDGYELKGTFSRVPVNLHQLVINAPIKNIFVTDHQNLGTDFNVQAVRNESNEIIDSIRWDHLFYKIDKSKVNRTSDSNESIQGVYRTKRQVFKRALEELSNDSITDVIDFIEQNTLYRGKEKLTMLSDFQNHKSKYSSLSEEGKELYTWAKLDYTADLRNSAIGTLLQDLSEERDAEDAIKAYNVIVAPANYKQTNAVITTAQKVAFQNEIKSLGLEDSLPQRFANIDDIDINNVLFIDKTIRSKSIFEQLDNEIAIDASKIRYEEIGINDFISDLLPKCASIEALIENRHNNFVSLLHQVNSDFPSLFKWDNKESWVYQNGLTDSVEERIKAKGGTVDGELVVSLDWFNTDDLDLSIVEPNKTVIYFHNKESRTSGRLDVDMNIHGESRDPVENIAYSDKTRMFDGIYEVFVTNFTKRENIDTGFNVTIKFNGEKIHVGQNTPVGHKERIHVASIHYQQGVGVTNVERHIGSKLPVSKDVWGIKTQKFHKVNLISYSPNYWGYNQGNQHVFFMLDKAVNPDNPRCTFNEFLRSDLHQHRKAFDAVGKFLKVESTENQLSGLGFSLTQRNHLICKVVIDNSVKFVKINF
jgi:hypothetical protein